MCFVDSRVELFIALSSFPGLPICLRRQYNWTSLVRLSESIVSGGSVTTSILSQIPPVLSSRLQRPLWSGSPRTEG